MQKISHPPTGSWIRVRQNEQQVRFKLPGVTGINLFMAAALLWMSFDLLRRSSILQPGARLRLDNFMGNDIVFFGDRRILNF